MEDLKYTPTVYNKGYIGKGTYKPSLNRRKTKVYSKWNNILHRSYSESYKEKQPTYKDVTVCEEWHNFQNFAKWFEDNYVEGFELDKDILVKGNKIYSPETCCFVPKEINSLFKNYNNNLLPTGISYDKINKKYKVSIRINGKMKTKGRYVTVEEAFKVYKTAKETYIKEVADKWKEQISDKVYQAMYNYKL